jgi:hypothetical protein
MRNLGPYELRLMLSKAYGEVNESVDHPDVRARRPLDPTRKTTYKKLSLVELKRMIEDCGAAKKLDQYIELDDANIVPDEAYLASHVGASDEHSPPVGVDPTLAPEEGGRNLGNGGKSRLSREKLHHIAEYSVELWNLLSDEDEIPEWCQSKIATIADDMSEVKHHLGYKVDKPTVLKLDGE